MSGNMRICPGDNVCIATCALLLLMFGPKSPIDVMRIYLVINIQIQRNDKMSNFTELI